VNKGVNIHPRGQISPLGAKVEVKNGPQDGLSSLPWEFWVVRSNPTRLVVIEIGTLRERRQNDLEAAVAERKHDEKINEDQRIPGSPFSSKKK
jgi:hypothetical protein